MDLAPLRALVREVNFSTHGVAAVLTVPDGLPVATHVVWLTPRDMQTPRGEFQRNEPQRNMAIRRDDIPTLPRGTVVSVTEHLLEEPSEWMVDAIDFSQSDHYRVIVVPYEDL